MLRIGLWIACSLLVAGRLQAVEPGLGSISPYGLQRGSEVEVSFGGGRLSDAQELLFYSPGIAVKKLEAANDGLVKATLAVAADCRMGIHAVRIRTATGISNLMTFTVGPFAEVAEVEPNSEFGQPQAVPMNVTISGVVQNEDVDHFVVEAKKGERITAELEGLRLGRTFFDPYLAILNSARFELSRSDDNALLNQDCLCSVIAPEDGKYIIQVRESAYGGDGNCIYRLHIGSYPRPTAVYPAGGRAGETMAVRWIGDGGGDFTSQVTLPNTLAAEVGLHAQDDRGISPSPNNVRVADLQNHLEVEPNDAVAQASPSGPAPLALNGIIEQPGDVDYFKFSAKAGQQYDVRVYARGVLRSPLDSVMTIYNAQGGGIVGNDDAIGPDSYARFAVPADGDYLISVNDHLRQGGPSFVYRVEVTPVVASLTMGLPERSQYVPHTIVVPKGNRTAFLVTAGRTNWGGDLLVDLQGLPAGLALEAQPMPANRSDIPVLISAAAEASPAGALVDLVGRSADANLKIEGHLNQRTMLVRGQNNIDVWGHNADRMAVALADAVPFKIDIVQPKAPIVRNGAMDLKIVATRAPEFKTPISVFLLYNPPGIGSSGSVAIPEGQNEALIPLSANGGAEIKTWKIVVMGRAGFGNGTVEASTQLADLVIADQYHNLSFGKAACEQGQDTEMVVKVEKKLDFDGEATAELLGLPPETSTAPLKFNKDTAELVFKIKVNPAAKPGKYAQLLCRTTFQIAGEPVMMTVGTGELRIDQPLPPKVAAPMPPPMPTAAPMPEQPKPPEQKRLTRLEQLRLEREQQGKK
ncbi:MAG: peptidase [Planctomycetes bacterium]|nr:peptidase [Planctomycetota bacterium]